MTGPYVGCGRLVSKGWELSGWAGGGQARPAQLFYDIAATFHALLQASSPHPSHLPSSFLPPCLPVRLPLPLRISQGVPHTAPQ